jgi:N utilization substance protein B
MLNRRHIRIKVMQSVYALLQSKNDDLVREEKFLYYSINKLYDLFSIQLNMLLAVKKLVEKRLEISKSNRISVSDNNNGSENYIQNKCLKIIESSDSFNDFISSRNLNNWSDVTEYVQIIWDDIKKSTLFEKYSSNKTTSFAQDKSFIIAVFKEIIAPHEKLFDYYESENIGWIDDLPFINTAIVKALNKLEAQSTFVLEDLYKDEDDKKFVKNLFLKTILHHTEYDAEIDKKTPNWDYDRISEIDLILIKMAITEFLYFPSIPTKVTINEYIELAKDYSSDKSSYFVNGVLDKMLKNFQKDKKINKIGRGLI